MRAWLVALGAVCVCLASASPATAFGLLEGQDGFTGAVYRAGVQDPSNYADQAGEHPDTGVIKFGLQTDNQANPKQGQPIGRTRDIRVEIPPGLEPNIEGFGPRCTDEQLNASGAPCPPESQVGVIELTISSTIFETVPARIDVTLPVYNMQPGPDQLARFAFVPRSAPLADYLTGTPDDPSDLSPIEIIGGVRDTSDYGLYFTIKAPRNPILVASKLTFWGTPGASKHDALRGYRRSEANSYEASGDPLVFEEGGNVAVDNKTRPFLTNPTSCRGILNTRIFVTSYDEENDSANFDTPYGARDCPGVPFAPEASFDTTAPTRDAPTGFDIGIDVPQAETDATRGTSHVRRLAVALPRGVTINPSAGNGIATCTDAQFAAQTHDPIACPDRSRIGTASVTSTLLPDALGGALYLGQPFPGDRYRLFAVLEGRGASIRLKGSVKADAETGQLTAVFDDLPELPFSTLKLHVDGGPTGILAAPQDCSPAAGLVSLGPWSGNAAAQLSQSIQATGCAAPVFAPGFAASTGSAKSGAYSTAVARIARDNGQQFLRDVKVDLPPGLLARAAGRVQCSTAGADAGVCPAASRVGTASVRAGAGSSPLALSGAVYFTGPYKGAPFGLVTVIHAVAGPYDLGNVVVRQALDIDPRDAHVTLTSDPLPQVVGGIPLRLRNLVFDVNAAKFVINPTSCGAGSLRGAFASAQATAAAPAATVTFSGCGALKFTPRLALSLHGSGALLRDGGHPGLLARLRGTGIHGQAGLKRVKVTLPSSLALDPGNAESLCEYAEATKTNPRCPAGSLVGRAKARTSILAKTLTAKVYLAKRVRTNAAGRQVATLPMLVVPLRGNGVKINLIGTTSVSRGRLVTTFDTPDAPVTAFDLRVLGGARGVLVANTDVCAAPRDASVGVRGQNDATVDRSAALRAACR